MALADGFQNTSQLCPALCSGYGWDSQRKLVYPTRSRGDNYMNEPWPNTNLWGGAASGTATRTWINPGAGGTGNSAQNSGVQFDTGIAVGSEAHYARILPVLPVDYGLFMLVALPSNSGNMADSVVVQIQNAVDNQALVIKLNASGVYVEDSAGVDHLLAAHSPPYTCEDWLQPRRQSSGLTKIDLLQGTQLNGSVTIQLPTGNPASAGLVQIQQLSGANAHQQSQMFQINIGDTQLSDDCFLAWGPETAEFDAQAVNVLIKVEDDCAGIIANIDLICDIQINGGVFAPVHLTEYLPDPTDTAAVPFKGILDFTKRKRVFGGVLPAQGLLQGQAVLPRVRLVNGKLGAFISFGQDLVSYYPG